MARGINRLSVRAAQNLKRDGLTADGGGLYLSVTKGSGKNQYSRSWIFRWERNGRVRHMGLGSIITISLAEARERARETRRLVLDGVDPIAKRDSERAAALAKSAAVKTFDECLTDYITTNRASWSSLQHAREWESSVKRLASPVLGKLNVRDIETSHVLKVLEPIWQEKPVTASRLRGRIEAILDSATVRKFRAGDNPARWQGYLSQILPKPGKISKVEHMARLAIDQMPGFVAELRQRIGISARALEFLCLTAVRTADVRNARWSHIDLKARVWCIPEFSKIGGEHRVPLSAAALHVLKKAHDLAVEKSDLVFPGLHKNSMLVLLAKMGKGAGIMTGHGCRSAFRSWAAERTNVAREVAEAALGHTIGSKVEASYQRSDVLEKRRLLMEQWATFLSEPVASGEVVPFHKTASSAE
jgi:integrase